NGGTSVISTEMVSGAGDAGYALQVADTNAIHWGGTLLFYLPPGGGAGPCLNAQGYGGLELSIKGSSPTGRFGVSLGMRDTIAVADDGLCDSATASDCKNASIELSLPAEPAT